MRVPVWFIVSCLMCALCGTYGVSGDAHAMCGMTVNRVDPNGFETDHIVEHVSSNAPETARVIATPLTDATQVVLMRDGTTTVVTMRNNYRGPAEEFLMVVPVPQVLRRDDVKVLKDEVFERVSEVSSPRLIEYREDDPCPERSSGVLFGGTAAKSSGGLGSMRSDTSEEYVPSEIRIEDEFKVGEYDISVLSATESRGLLTWLESEGWGVPDGADALIQPYIEQGMYFFVAKVDPSKLDFDDGEAKLSALRFHYDSEDFALPIRLGLINAEEHQDLLIHILAKNQRYEVANYSNVFLPTGLKVKRSTLTRFSSFYESLFLHTMNKNKGAVVTEYARRAFCSGCDLTGLGDYHLRAFGLDVIDPGMANLGAGIRLERARALRVEPHKITRQVRGRARRFHACLRAARRDNPSVQGAVTLSFEILESGRVGDVKPYANRTGSSELAECVARELVRVRFAPPEQSDLAYVTLKFAPKSAIRRDDLSEWVLTRLRTRYSRESAGEDLIFATRPAVSGGFGEPEGAKGEVFGSALEQSTDHMFAARFITTTPWRGKIRCKDPIRGNWYQNVSFDTPSDVVGGRERARKVRAKAWARQLVGKPKLDYTVRFQEDA